MRLGVMRADSLVRYHPTTERDKSSTCGWSLNVDVSNVDKHVCVNVYPCWPCRPTISPRMRHPGAQQQPAAASPGLLPSPASPQKSGRVTLLMPVSPPRARPHEEHGGTGGRKYSRPNAMYQAKRAVLAGVPYCNALLLRHCVF